MYSTTVPDSILVQYSDSEKREVEEKLIHNARLQQELVQLQEVVHLGLIDRMEETDGIILFEEIEPGTLQYRELVENMQLKENGKLITSTKLSQLVKDYASTQNAKKETAELDQL